MTETIIVERTFEAPTTMAELQAREDAVAWCLAQHGVRAVASLVALDGRAAVCVYEAPDAEAVRATQRQGGLPFDHVWPAVRRGTLAARAGNLIVAQRELPAPVTMELVETVLATHGHCLELHRAELLASHLAHDGLRMVCVFDAPDAESVRIANRQLPMPVTRLWPARLFT